MLGGFVLVAAVTELITAGFWIVEQVDLPRREFPEPIKKMVRVLVILCTRVLGPIIYHFVRSSMAGGRPEAG